MDKKELLESWVKLKKEIKKKSFKLDEIRGKIETAFGSFSSKSKTFSELGFKINIKKNETVSLDQEAYKDVRLDIPEKWRPEKVKFEIEGEGLKWLEKNKPEIFKTVSNCITLKPGKTGITVEKI